MSPAAAVKSLVRSAAAQLGYRIVPETTDPVLQALLASYNELRLNPANVTLWDHSLARLASLSHLRSLVRLHAIDLLLDVGANRGQFALDARRAGYSGDIISFEPLSRHQPTLARLAAADGRWRIVPSGLGASSTSVDLNVYRDDTFSSVLPVNASATHHFGEMVALDHVERIQIRPLDDCLAELGLSASRRILLKTDTQGYDAAVLAGAAHTLRQTQVVLSEATVAPLYDRASSFEDITARLTALGFARAGLFPIGYAPRGHTLIELDCYFCRPAPPSA